MEYQLIRSDRKTLSVAIRGTQVIVRAPNRCPQKTIDAFVAKNEDWIKTKLAENAEKSKAAGQAGYLSDKEIRELAEKALAYIPGRVAMYAKTVGVTYGNITIRCQRTKWGSCSGKGNLNFNCLLMLMPPEVIDSVIVHELCHRKEMNHSARFYEEVRRVFPAYDRCHKWLKENGGVIMSRVK